MAGEVGTQEGHLYGGTMVAYGGPTCLPEEALMADLARGSVPVLVVIALLIGACTGDATQESVSTTNPVVTTSTAVSTTTSVASTTTTTAPTTTTLPATSEASVDGSWDAVIEYVEGPLAEGPPDNRVYVFTSDCSVDPCSVSGTVEIGTESGVETRDVDLEREGTDYMWSFVDEEIFEENGEVLCKWIVTRNFTIRVEEAEVDEGVWTATRMSGDFLGVFDVEGQAEGVICESEGNRATISLERSE